METEFIIDQWNVLNFDLRGRTSGKFATTCVHCSSSRKKSKEKCCNIDLGTGKYTCSHCAKTGNLHSYRRADGSSVAKVYKLPVIKKQNATDLPDAVVDWFKGRGINQSTLIEMKIMAAPEWMPQVQKEVGCILFPYFDEIGVLTNIKFRTRDKHFKMSKDAKLIPYNLDKGVKAAKEKGFLIICEGEMDALTYIQEGYMNVISVPNGATVSPDETREYNNTGDIKAGSNLNLEWLDNSYAALTHTDIKSYYISTDSDAAGFKMRMELIRRFGAAKSKVINLGQHKDSNEVLMNDEDPSAIKNAVESAIQQKVKGIILLDDVEASMLHDFHHGKPRGTTTYIPQLDIAWTWRNSEMNVWTGYNNEGKGTFFKYISTLKARFGGQKMAIFTPEDMPVNDFYDDIIHMYIGKPVEQWNQFQMSIREYKQAMDFVREHFFVVYDKDPSLNKILDLFQHLVATRGVSAWCIDPYNTTYHESRGGETTDLYVSRYMGRVKEFCLETNTSGHLVAHQKTPDGRDKNTGNYPKPSLYRIKGGGTFGDKADNVISIWKQNRGSDSADPSMTFISEKIKKWRLVGKPSEVGFQFDWKTNRFLYNGHSPLSTPFTTQGVMQMEEPEPVLDIPQGTDEGYGDDAPF